MFDLNDDMVINAEDLIVWVEDLKQTHFGDANLDGEINFPDFLALSANFGGPGGWGPGDFDADGEVLFNDFLNLSNNFGQGSTEVANVVPEPSSALLGIIGWLIFTCMRRNRSVRLARMSCLIHGNQS